MKSSLNHGEIVHPKTGQAMVWIPGASFRMGDDNGGEFERPTHLVRVSSFWIDRTLVSNLAFARFIADTGFETGAERRGLAWGLKDGKYTDVQGLSWRSYATPERAEHPVVLVSWEDASAYCRWADVRLPSEAEWEYVARDGSESVEFPWGASPPDGTQCNFARSSEGVPPTTPGGTFGSNSMGVADLVGNTWQWCEDWYEGTYYSQSPEEDPRGPGTGQLKVRRGGAWNVIQPFRLRCSNRGAMRPHLCAPNVGFRCVASASQIHAR